MTSRKTTTDPHIQDGWINLRAGLTADLKDHVAAHVVDDLVTRIIANRIAGPGWKPPLGPVPQVVRDARIKHAMEAGQ
ncbi:hypothetical protein [Acrocarpospora sp. B8E8]|uniref:hypothetical protein n=1 Tax=Acrocarpospora sp. B8E8 TaxID=3153572 RepID=UPI00325C7008